jgi:feruloyl esterase
LGRIFDRGRQALKEAQANPQDFDGILAGAPAINWTRFITGELNPQIVMQRDLGGKHLTPAQLSTVSNAAISACDLVGTFTWVTSLTQVPAITIP